MSNIVARGFCGLGLDLRKFGIHNERPDGSYLDENLQGGIFSCMLSDEGNLYFGITPVFPWEEKAYGEMPRDEETAKRMIAMRLLEYLNDERSRLDKEELEEDMPTMDDIIAGIGDINESWIELW